MGAERKHAAATEPRQDGAFRARGRRAPRIIRLGPGRSGEAAATSFERDGYSYSVNCSGADFTVTGRHPEPPDGGQRYLTLTLDSRLQIHESY